MASNPPLQAMFGAGASQTASQLIIQKADLVAPPELQPTYTFIPALDNSSESIALALIARWIRGQDQATDRQLGFSPFEMALDFNAAAGKYQRIYTSITKVRIDDTFALFPSPNEI